MHESALLLEMVPVPAPDVVRLKGLNKTPATSGVQFENSEVPLTGWVAVAVATPEFSVLLNRPAPDAVPSAAVVTATEPK